VSADRALQEYPDVPLGGTATQLAAGSEHTCALMTGGGVRCWGTNLWGELGYVSAGAVGDDETPASAGDVPLGALATAVVAGKGTTCAILTDRSVRCWGRVLAFPGNAAGASSVDASHAVTPDVGSPVMQLALGELGACALVQGGAVICFGGTYQTAQHVTLPEPATSVNVAAEHACAVLASGKVACWGAAGWAWMYGSTGVSPDGGYAVDPFVVDVGGRAVAVDARQDRTCALLDTGGVRCWGQPRTPGPLGYGNVYPVRPDQVATLGDLLLGARATALAGTASGECALTDRGTLRCWGSLDGYPRLGTVGDDEPAGAGGDLTVW
jgi:alpha-tubulin suppressor-like RCC1 family protein